MAEPASVWALGILLHVMLTGSVPFTSDVEIVRCNLNLPARINYGEAPPVLSHFVIFIAHCNNLKHTL